MQWFQNLTKYIYSNNELLGYEPQNTRVLYSVLFRLHFLYLVHFWKLHYKELLKILKIKKNEMIRLLEIFFRKKPLKQIKEYEGHM